MKVIVLGCGTSSGVPMIGCNCPVCSSKDQKNSRTRTSLLVCVDGKNILIDTTVDLRFQILREKINRIEAVLYTHTHADHLHGIDDLRGFNFVQRKKTPVYAAKRDLEHISSSFKYIFDPTPWGGGKPELELIEIRGPFEIKNIKIIPLPILHGSLEILGFRIGKLAYLTDCSKIPKSTYPLLRGIDVLIIGALRHKKHPTHFSLSEVISESKKIGAKRTYLVHMTHWFDYWMLKYSLPKGLEPAYDGLVIEV